MTSGPSIGYFIESILMVGLWLIWHFSHCSITKTALNPAWSYLTDMPTWEKAARRKRPFFPYPNPFICHQFHTCNNCCSFEQLSEEKAKKKQQRFYLEWVKAEAAAFRQGLTLNVQIFFYNVKGNNTVFLCFFTLLVSERSFAQCTISIWNAAFWWPHAVSDEDENGGCIISWP